MVILSQEIVYLCYITAVYQISISYYAWNMSKSLCAVWVVWWWLKPIIVLSLAQAEQFYLQYWSRVWVTKYIIHILECTWHDICGLNWEFTDKYEWYFFINFTIWSSLVGETFKTSEIDCVHLKETQNKNLNRFHQWQCFFPMCCLN